jgi:hypothetical protein
MERLTRSRLAALIASIWLAASLPAVALERGATADGWPYLAGGFGLEEREELALARNDYRLRVATAARGSGAYLANVRIRIADVSGRILFDRELPGPVLLIDLAPGRYTVQASFRGETMQTPTQIGVGERREMYFYFQVPGEVPRADDNSPR